MSAFLRPKIQARLDGMVARFHELTARASSPETLAQPQQLGAIQRELGTLARLVDRYEDFRTTVQNGEENEALVGPDGDPELRELAEAELPELREKAQSLADGLIEGADDGTCELFWKE